MCEPTALAEREGVAIIHAHVASGTEVKSWLCSGNMFHLRVSVGFHRAKLATGQTGRCFFPDGFPGSDVSDVLLFQMKAKRVC